MFRCLLHKEFVVLKRDYLIIFGLLCNIFLLSANPKITSLRAGAMCKLAQGNKNNTQLFQNHQYYIEAEVKFVKNVGIIFLLFL